MTWRRHVLEALRDVTQTDNGVKVIDELLDGMPEAIDPEVVVFDLDGTLCETTKAEYMKAEPIPEAIERVNELFASGVRIIIDTARGSGSGESWQIRTTNQLKEWGVNYHELRCGVKFNADLYVDDRGVSAGEWLNDG